MPYTAKVVVELARGVANFVFAPVQTDHPGAPAVSGADRSGMVYPPRARLVLYKDNG